MEMMLSNYGHRLLLAMNRGDASQDPRIPVLTSLRSAVTQNSSDIPDVLSLQEAGLIQEVPAGLCSNDVQLRYQRNPLENISRVVFEYTTLCNLSCHHCRNGNLSPVTSRDLNALKRVVDVVIPLGIRRFDFIGGEVLLYGMKWPELARHIQAAGGQVNMLTSGWFLEQENFWAAGERHTTSHAFLQRLAEVGVTHLTFSLDGPRDVHDVCREVDGLYDRIMRGIPHVRAAGVQPQVSLMILPRLADQILADWLSELGGHLYPDRSPQERLDRLQSDPMNYLSHFIDVGNGTGMMSSGGKASDIPDRFLRCKNFFRPAPTLRFKATGELSLCPLIDAGDGYGNLHDTDPIALLNGMQDAFVYRLHAENRIVDYRPLVDPAIFSDVAEHVCSHRVIVTMLAQAIHEAGYDAQTVPPALLQPLNVKVARRVGHLPSETPSPLGRPAPGA
ncbi:MAG: radical SAM protein [Myxococcota bacterium]